MSRHLSYVTVVLAMSADGKISDAFNTAARFPSAADKRHLEQCLFKADATLFGANTLRAYGSTAMIAAPHLLAQRGHKKQPIHIVCSLSGQLDPTARFFSQPVRRWLLTTAVGAKPWDGQASFERIWIGPTDDHGLDWPQILAELKTQGIDRLLVMGGGQLVATLMAVDLIDELWLTVCPLVIGGAQSPTPCDGDGFSLDRAPRLTLISAQTVGDEVFLNYCRQR